VPKKLHFLLSLFFISKQYQFNYNQLFVAFQAFYFNMLSNLLNMEMMRSASALQKKEKS